MRVEKNRKENERIRVLHIITIFSLGGATENTLLSVEGLHELGYDVRILTGPNITSEGSLFDRAERNGVKVQVIPHLMRSIHPLYDFISFLTIFAVLKRGKYHIVHTHSSKAGFLGRIAAKLAGIPVIIHTIHGLPFHNYQNRVLRGIFIAAEKIGALCSDRIITVTDTIAKKALVAGVGKKDQFVTVRSGFEMDQFVNHRKNDVSLRKQFGIEKSALVVGKIARFSNLKGHQYLIDVIPEVVRQVPNVKFLFVGSGEMEQLFRNRVIEKGVKQHVVFTGLVAQEEIASMISIMDIVVHTSLLEGLARVLPQALAAGKPVVSFNIDGAHEVVINGVSGYLVDPLDEKGLAQAIVELLGDKKKAKIMGLNGKEIVIDQWTKEAMVKGIDIVYKEQLVRKQILKT